MPVPLFSPCISVLAQSIQDMVLTAAYRKWLAAGLCLIGAYFLTAYLNNPESRYALQPLLHRWQRAPVALDDATGEVECTINENHLLAYYRLAFTRSGPSLEARPSEKAGGGAWKKFDANAPELDYIGLNRFEEIILWQRPADEDEFAHKLRLIGAIWRPLAPDEGGCGSRDECGCDCDCDITGTQDSVTARRRWLAWPSSGGLWAFEASQCERWTRDDVRKLAGMWRVAVTMDEAAQLLKDMGRAVFYKNPADYPPLADLYNTI
ncbi:hypothetical protein McanMca71_003082 [Microsporum canis]|uniref:Uncharacterized protein n=1 Tax=Arthroderma otae (strain ATCC MYA-4605 / CBS 113480) TaxID=554155 RepID=C5G050_ARTOC|nr:uncharacterized protein MCYG_08322 [Microsporum canis CBS 113480]EEQ35503.1 predicted protein [Microsporum canis CBS 113480]